MRVAVNVKPNARRPGVEKMPDGSYRVAVNASPIEGKANEAVIKALSDYFSVPKSAVRIVMGFRGKKKLVEIVQAKNS